MKKTILITGATSGIGAACAEKFAAAGDDLILTGRRADRLEATKQQLESRYLINVIPLCFDVQDRAAVFAAAETVYVEKIDVLINNAGLALGRAAIDDAEIEDWETMMHTNVDGLLYVTRAFLPKLKAAQGHVINIGSVAGKQVYENGSVYCASKFAVDALSKAMRIDLLKYKIKVTAVHPGAVETEFSVVRFKGDTEKAASTYVGFAPLSPADVAESIFYCASLPPNVCINELVITPLAQADANNILRV